MSFLEKQQHFLDLSSSLTSNSKAKQCGFFSISLHLELSKACSMALDRLRHLPVHRVQLHCSDHTVLLQRNKLVL